jgi:hypothetical protein
LIILASLSLIGWRFPDILLSLNKTIIISKDISLVHLKVQLNN